MSLLSTWCQNCSKNRKKNFYAACRKEKEPDDIIVCDSDAKGIEGEQCTAESFRNAAAVVYDRLQLVAQPIEHIVEHSQKCQGDDQGE